MWTKWSLKPQVPLNQGSKAVLLRRNVLVTKTLSSQGPKHLATFHQLWWPCKKTPFGRELRPHDRTTLREKHRPKQKSSGTSSSVCLQNQDDKKEASGREPPSTPQKLLKPMYECTYAPGPSSTRTQASANVGLSVSGYPVRPLASYICATVQFRQMWGMIFRGYIE